MVLFIGGFVAAGGAAAFWWRSRDHSTNAAAVSFDLAGVEPTVDEPGTKNPGYLGPQACAACHAERVAEFRNTSHFRACREALASEMPAGFAEGHGTIQTRDAALRFEMARTGNEFVQTTVRSTPAGEQRTNSRIDLVYGVGNADAVYFSWRDDALYELPMVWLYTFNRWGASHYHPYRSDDFSREMTPRCLECHNTWFEHIPGTLNRYKRDHFILGVGCERCHGPGRDHVAYHEAHQDVKDPYAIVRPAHLSRDRQMDLCTQCHSNAIKHKGPAFSYRPGEPLDAYYKTIVSRHTEEDHVANQTQYLRESKCFQKSETLTCITCHDPHRPTAATGLTTSTDSCMKCHQPVDCGDHDRLPAQVRSNCVGCHMPQYIKINVNFQTEDDDYVPPIRRYDHRIAVHPTARQGVLREWHLAQSDDESRREAARLTIELVEFWRSEAQRCSREHRHLGAIAALREALLIDDSSVTRDQLRAAVAVQSGVDADWATALHLIERKRFKAAADVLVEILKVQPNLARAHGKLGTVYAILGESALAAQHLGAVARHDPDDAYGESMLGWLDYLGGQFDEALEHYRRADEIEPFDAPIHFKTGLALVKLDRLPEAIGQFREVLSIDPNHIDSCVKLNEVLRRQGETQEALRFAQHAAQLTKFQEPDVMLVLAETYAEVGRWPDADAAAEQALQAAQKGDAQRVPQIRLRIQGIRARAGGAPH